MATMTAHVKMQKHSERSHALLSASGASRWLNCTPSARLEERCGGGQATVYAQEGTLAHELAELYLRRDALQAISDSDFDARFEEIMNNELFNEEMLDYVPMYTDYCSGQFKEAQTRNAYAQLIIEQKIDLRAYIPESFGTADCIVIDDGVMEVIDLKYGKGIPVSAEWNKQLMLYGLGSLLIYDTVYDITTLRLTIVQPRLDNISTWEISSQDLYNWADNELKPKAKAAYAGEGELNAGEWCKFCAVKNRCRKLYEQQLEIAKLDFQDPELLTDDEIAEVVQRLPKLLEWANSVSDYALDQATRGKEWKGLKLVEGVSRRKWVDEDKALQTIFARMPQLSEDEILVSKLKPITAIEKLVGKQIFAEKLSDIIIKPQGKPTLVPESDPRPGIGLASARADFAE